MFSTGMLPYICLCNYTEHQMKHKLLSIFFNVLCIKSHMYKHICAYTCTYMCICVCARFSIIIRRMIILYKCITINSAGWCLQKRHFFQGKFVPDIPRPNTIKLEGWPPCSSVLSTAKSYHARESMTFKVFHLI